MIHFFEDYFSVAIDQVYETKTRSGLILLNDAYVDEEDMDRHEHKRIQGTVLSVPDRFSDKGFMPVNDGIPDYRKFVGHDDIVDKINRGYRSHDDKTYYPSTFDAYDVITIADLAMDVDVKVGDRVYFLPQVIEPENLIDRIDGKDVYMVNVTDIICSVRDEGKFVTMPKIYMQGRWVLVKEDMETWEEITTTSGIITKANPEKKWLRGTVKHTRHKHLREGQSIVYVPNADCPVIVEGENYAVMPAEDILGEI